MNKRSKWCLIGIPDHQGVVNVGGRIGAVNGPRAFREAMSRMKGIHPLLAKDIDISAISKDIVENHQRAAQEICKAQADENLTIVVGGGHDHGYSHLLGVKEALLQKNPNLRLGCINIDAHLDLRKSEPFITSGSPFYLALESEVIQGSDLIEFGIQGHCNGPELFSYAKKHQVTVHRYSSIRKDAISAFELALNELTLRCDAVVVSFDLDAVAAGFAPGVSAPQAEGFSPSEIMAMMECSGSNDKVVSLGIFELNPIHDIEGRTALLAATAAHRFISSAILNNDSA